MPNNIFFADQRADMAQAGKSKTRSENEIYLLRFMAHVGVRHGHSKGAVFSLSS